MRREQALPPDKQAQVALTLRMVGGLTTEEIARAFLVPVPTVAQRIVRAKKTLAEARVPFEVPRRAEFAARLSLVLAVVYLIDVGAVVPPSEKARRGTVSPQPRRASLRCQRSTSG